MKKIVQKIRNRLARKPRTRTLYGRDVVDWIRDHGSKEDFRALISGEVDIPVEHLEMTVVLCEDTEEARAKAREHLLQQRPVQEVKPMPSLKPKEK